MRVVQIMSAAFSGSTLLDALFDSQDGYHGLGEVAQLTECKPPHIRRGPCHICLDVASRCSFWGGWQKKASDNPLTFAHDCLGGTLVDSSKQPKRFVRPPHGCEVRRVAIIKTPQEWAHSVRAHDLNEGRALTPFDQCIFHWLNLHREIIRSKPDLAITYFDLTSNLDATMSKIMAPLGSVWMPPGDAMWSRKSHALGGNPAVIEQSNEAAGEMRGGRKVWLSGKYSSDKMWRKVSYDDSWVRAVGDAYYQDPLPFDEAHNEVMAALSHVML